MNCTSLAAAIDDVALGAPMSAVLARHLASCEACATQLERRRVLAQRIDRAVAAHVGAELSPELSGRIAARAALQQPAHRSAGWLGVSMGFALACAALMFFWPLPGLRVSTPAFHAAALEAWRSPTASLLITRGNVLGTHFTLSSSHIKGV